MTTCSSTSIDQGKEVPAGARVPSVAGMRLRDADPVMRLLWRIVKTVFGSLFLAIVALVGAPAAFAVTALAALIFLPLAGDHSHSQAESLDPADRAV